MFNEITLIARLGKDPEMKFTPSQKAVCSLWVATSEVSTKDGNRVERVQWHSVIAWEKLAETCSKFLHKGSLVFIKGRLEYREYNDKSGVKHKVAEIIASTVKFLSPKNNDAAPTEAPMGHDFPPPAQASMVEDFGNIPF